MFTVWKAEIFLLFVYQHNLFVIYIVRSVPGTLWAHFGINNVMMILYLSHVL